MRDRAEFIKDPYVKEWTRWMLAGPQDECKKQLEFWLWYGSIERALSKALGAPDPAAPAPPLDSYQGDNPGGHP